MHYILLKKILSQYPAENRVIFDPNNEYKGGLRYLNFERFKTDTEIHTNKVFIFEEATAFIGQGVGDLDIVNLLIRLRHKKNSAIFVFHSLRSIPVKIFDFIDRLYVFKTNDRLDLVLKKYKDVLTENEIKQLFKLEQYKFKEFIFTK